MKKLISAVLVLALVVTSLSCIGVLPFAAWAVDQPEKEEDLSGTIVVDSLDDYKAYFNAVEDTTYRDYPMASAEIGSLLYNDGTNPSNYWWSTNGYIVGLNTAKNTGYLKDTDKYTSVTVTTEFLTGANGMAGFELLANGKTFFTRQGLTQSGSDPTIGYRPKPLNAAQNPWWKIAVRLDEGTGSGQVDTSATIYAGNGQATGFQTANTPTVWSFTNGTKRGVVRDYFGSGSHAIVYQDDALTTALGTDYYYIYKGAKNYTYESQEYIIVEQYTNWIGSANNYAWGGVEGTVSYTATKTSGTWKITKLTFTIKDDLVQFGKYSGMNGTEKLVFTTAMTDNGDGTHSLSTPYTGTYAIGETLNLGLPRINPLANTKDAFANMYFKETTVDYEIDPAVYLAEFETAYADLATNGVTTDTVKKGAEGAAEKYVYVQTVRAKYDALTDFLKTYVNADKVTELQELEYAYNVGDSLSAWEQAYTNLVTALNSRDPADMTLADFADIKTEIDACRTQYNAIDDNLKQYVVSSQLELLVAVEGARAILAANKENGTFFADFSNDVGSNAALSTYFMNKVDANGKQHAIYGRANQNNKGLWITGMVNGIDDTTYGSDTAVVKIQNGKAVYALTRKAAYNSGHTPWVERSILQAVGADYLPENINKLSFTANLDDLATSGATYKEFVVLYGKNSNLSYYAEGDENLSDAPIFGTAVKIETSGKVTFGFAYYADEESNYFENTVLNHIITNYDMHSGSSGTPNTAMTNPGDFLEHNISPTGEINIEISFAPHSFDPGTTGKVGNVFRPTYTIVDETGTRLTGTPVVYSGTLDANSARVAHINTFATEIYGLAIGSFMDSSSTPSTLKLDDIYVEGEGAAAVTGATIKTTSEHTEQDLRFYGSVSGNTYLAEHGYKPTGYGYILAYDQSFVTEGLTALEINTLDKVSDEWVGTVKGMDDETYKVGYKELESGYGLPTEEFYINLTGSAAIDNGVGYRFRVRVFARYVHETTGEVKFIYSTNRAEGMMEGGEHVRSVYSTAKNIANAMLVKGDVTYNAYGEEHAEAFAAAITSILAQGTTVKSTTNITIGDSQYAAGEVLLKFTGENAAIIQG